MPDGREPVSIKIAGSIFDIDAGQWDACAGDDDPFIGHAFLGALEASGSAKPATGWMAQHLTIEDEAGALLACAPLYLKDNSYGEYVFDWGWADAYQRAGGSYYPKLQSAVPFIPATGRRLLVRPGAPASLAHALASGMVRLAERLGVSSVHVTFPTEAEWRDLGEAGYLLRLGRQFHWENRGYETFDDFLGELTSRKRKSIRRERRAIAEIARRLSIPLLDFVAVLDGQDVAALYPEGPASHHYNDRGHALVAKTVRRYIEDRGLIDTSADGSAAK